MNELVATLLARTGHPVRLVHLPRGACWAAGALLERVCGALGTARPPLLTRYAVRQVGFAYGLDVARAVRELGYAPRWDHRTGPL
jgi:nucleoside-diphosphate-sugar epimerase